MLTALTADAIARGIIATARHFGDDPIVAMTSKSAQNRRCLAPAAFGIAKAAGVPIVKVATLLGLNSATPGVVRTRDAEGFERAAFAAEDAVRAHLIAKRPKTMVRAPIDFRNKPLPNPITARDRIFNALLKGSMTAPALATILDIKELAVNATLRAMAQEGIAVEGPTPDAGRRYCQWSLAEAA